MMIYTYATYVVVSLAMTIWVGRSLHKNGRIFLVQTFQDREEVADSVNHLLLVGFYLINIGFVSLALKFGEKPVDAATAIEFLSLKIGIVIVVLGTMHFFNMFTLMRFSRSKIFNILDDSPEDLDGEDITKATEKPEKDKFIGDRVAPNTAGAY